MRLFNKGFALHRTLIDTPTGAARLHMRFTERIRLGPRIEVSFLRPYNLERLIFSIGPFQ
jgi:hypothetical protein